MSEYKTDRAMRILQITYMMHKISTQQRAQCQTATQHMNPRDFMFLAGVNNLNAKGAPVKMSDVADFFQITPAAVSQIMRRLENTGQVERTTTDEDRRSVFVTITPKGKETLLKDNLEKETLLQDMLEFLGDEDADELVRLMERVLDYFEKTKDQREK